MTRAAAQQESAMGKRLAGCYDTPMAEQTIAQPRGRIAELDVARSAALLAMAIYHFVFDLELFGFVPPTTATTGGWRLLALLTAGSFLFLVGVGLWLGHSDGIRWPSVWRRYAKIAAAALLITIATYVVFPQAFVFFGILHAIAVGSLLGLLVLRWPTWSLALMAAAVFALPHLIRLPVFDAPWLWWVGLQIRPIVAVDYVPILPWFGPVILGIIAARIAETQGLWRALSLAEPSKHMRRLGWPGRHSLLVYLAHQPVLISLVWLAAQIWR